MAKRIVFRTDRAGATIDVPAGYQYRVVDTLVGGLRLLPLLLRTFGTGRAFKTLAKVATPRRAYYAVISEGRVASDGWIMFGFCRSYPIGSEDHVIGPIYTAPQARGKGLASAALANALRYCKGRGAEQVYIDTTEDNAASRKTIEKAGFSPTQIVAAAPPGS